jgi:hypothetical protein
MSLRNQGFGNFIPHYILSTSRKYKMAGPNMTVFSSLLVETRMNGIESQISLHS